MPWKYQIKNLKMNGFYRNTKTINIRYRDETNMTWNILPDITIDKRGYIIFPTGNYFINNIPDSATYIEVGLKESCSKKEKIFTVYR